MTARPRNRHGTLTPRELEVLRAAADGEQAPDTARRLWLAPETIKYHRKNIRQQLGAHTIAQAVAIGYREGLLP